MTGEGKPTDQFRARLSQPRRVLAIVTTQPFFFYVGLRTAKYDFNMAHPRHLEFSAIHCKVPMEVLITRAFSFCLLGWRILRDLGVPTRVAGDETNRFGEHN